MTRNYIGQPQNRVDGRAKVTGAAKYAGEYPAPDLAYGFVVSSGIAKGRITSIDTREALAVPGVIQVYTHKNVPATARLASSYKDEVAPPGKPFRPLHESKILYSGQPIALVVAETFEIARYAATLVRVKYKVAAHETDLMAVRDKAYEPPKKRSGIPPPVKARRTASNTSAKCSVFHRSRCVWSRRMSAAHSEAGCVPSISCSLRCSPHAT